LNYHYNIIVFYTRLHHVNHYI